MKPFKWIKKHPFESLLIGAALVGTGGAAAGWFGPAAAAGEAAAGAGLTAAGDSVGAIGSSALGNFGASSLGAGASSLLGPLAFDGVGQAAGIAGGTLGAEFGGMTAAEAAGAGVGEVGAGASKMPMMFSPSSAEASLYGPMNTMKDTKMALGGPQGGWKMGPKEAMMLAQMAGGGQQEQRPLGAPQDTGNPMQRPAMMTQEQITKKWLLENDPNTYARIYGSPQPMGA